MGHRPLNLTTLLLRRQGLQKQHYYYGNERSTDDLGTGKNRRGQKLQERPRHLTSRAEGRSSGFFINIFLIKATASGETFAQSFP